MPLKDPIARRGYHSQYMRDYLAKPKNRKLHLARVRKNRDKHRAAAMGLVAQFRASGCRLCPEKEPCILTAHHLDPEKKDFNVADAIRRRYHVERVKRELAKCVCLCMNCHGKLHAGVIQLDAG